MWQKMIALGNGGGGNANIVDSGTAQATVTHGVITVAVNVAFSKTFDKVPEVWCNGQSQYWYGSVVTGSITTSGFTMRIYQAQQNNPILIKIDWIAVIREE